MSTIKQIHLNAPNCSGRGVRIRILTPTEVDATSIDAAKQLPEGGSLLELRVLEYRERLKRMIVSYTEPNLTPEQIVSATWIKADPEVLELDWNKLFGPRDDKFLVAIYRRFHEVSDDELEQIVGKALDVEAA